MHVVLIYLVVAIPVKLIIDTDIGGGGCNDVDDVAALCMAHALVDRGEAELLAVVQNSSPIECAGAISVLAHYYSHDDVPIGAYSGAGLDPRRKPLSYVPDLVSSYDSPIKNTSQVPDALAVYRKVLAEADDNSVVISSIGLLTNLEVLLKSPADAWSPLSGFDLVARKVKLLAVMGGKYPKSGSSGAECNLCGCYNGASAAAAATASKAAAYVFGDGHLPSAVRVIFSGFNVGVQVQSGGRLSSCAPDTNPCRRAFLDYEGGPNKSRFSWDPLTTLLAVRGVVPSLGIAPCVRCDGVNSVDAKTGENTWIAGDKTNQTYITLVDGVKAGDAIDALLCLPPKVAQCDR
jgi:inosine-uridine nucleoside N-ribohydrolase